VKKYRKRRGLTVKKTKVELDGFRAYLLEKGKREKTVEDYIRNMTNFHR
jgi:integrase/recombinase XerD